MKTINICWARGLVMGTALQLACLAAAAEVVVVVSAKSGVATLTPEQVSGIFLGKAKSYPDGSPAVALDQAESAPVRAEFYTKVVGKDEAQMKAYWSRLVFTGKGSPPKEAASSAEVKKSLAADPKLIGYMEKSAVDASVKVVYTAP